MKVRLNKVFFEFDGLRVSGAFYVSNYCCFTFMGRFLKHRMNFFYIP